MYEKFTDRSRRVMRMANVEAQRLNHEYIGTEHILLGLVKEGSGVAANVLKNLEVDLQKVRTEVEKLVQFGPEMDKKPHTFRAQKVIEFALNEARLNHDNYVGTEHLLLGLLREGGGVAAQVLVNLGLNLQQVLDEILALVGKGGPAVPGPNFDKAGEVAGIDGSPRRLHIEWKMMQQLARLKQEVADLEKELGNVARKPDSKMDGL